MFKKLIIGTRGSKLALAQASLVRDQIIKTHNYPDELIEIMPIITTGDRILDRNLTELGGKGLFTKEIEEKLVTQEIDLAVHSMKDMPSFLPDNLQIIAMLEREDPRDMLIGVDSLDAIPFNSKFGTSSTRRSNIIKNLRPDLEIIPFRGNVQTRLAKLEAKVASATILACAGINRLHITDLKSHILDEDIFVPAIAQGAIGVECNLKNEYACEIVKSINHKLTYDVVNLERIFLQHIDGSCKIPIAGICKLNNNMVKMNFLVANPISGQIYREQAEIAIDQAEEYIMNLAKHMKQYL